ncbi:hypothetical protein F4860DRAFT_238768 [Xylaria cubensis]|nr:hypothetical protein F4860DRAFT_238768 [Xylaria cubensis]
MLRKALITYLASLALATTTPNIWCLTPRDGDKLARDYAALFSSSTFTSTKACSVLAHDFTETSDSINAISGLPSGNVTYESREAFIAAQVCWPAVAMDVVAVVAVTCDTVVLRWTQRWSDGTEIAGISILVAEDEGDGNGGEWKIRRVYEEFNGFAVLGSFGEVVGIQVCQARR